MSNQEDGLTLHYGDNQNRCCTQCGASLSMYNKTKECFAHSVKDQRTAYDRSIYKTTYLSAASLANTDTGDMQPEPHVFAPTCILTPEELIAIVLRECDVTKEALLGSLREASIVLPRQILMYLLSTDLRLSSVRVAEIVGGRHHSTVLYSVSKMSAIVEDDIKIRRIIMHIRAQYPVDTAEQVIAMSPNSSALEIESGVEVNSESLKNMLMQFSPDGFLSELDTRAQDILCRRYGIGGSTDKMTLDGIGSLYELTRERVRQIERSAIEKIRCSQSFRDAAEIFNKLRCVILEMGSIVSEYELLTSITNDKAVENRAVFLLALALDLFLYKEDDDLVRHWGANKRVTICVDEALRMLVPTLDGDAIIPESEMLRKFLDHLGSVDPSHRNKNTLFRWLRLSKHIGRNLFGEWGLVSSSNIVPSGIRDVAYLVLRKAAAPLHFKEVAQMITEQFGTPAHVATTHNELIKDERFVLVGRGRYALAEWGYAHGVVRDVIAEILKTYGPLFRKEVIEKVLKKRFVKENTIIVNLSNDMFTTDDRGRYVLASI